MTNKIIFDLSLSPSARILYLDLCDLAEDGVFETTMRYLEWRHGSTKVTVFRNLKELVKAGYVTKEIAYEGKKNVGLRIRIKEG